jgi:hypothetical protein
MAPMMSIGVCSAVRPIPDSLEDDPHGHYAGLSALGVLNASSATPTSPTGVASSPTSTGANGSWARSMHRGLVSRTDRAEQAQLKEIGGSPIVSQFLGGRG